MSDPGGNEAAGPSEPRATIAAKGRLVRLKRITRDLVRSDPQSVYVFGDNMYGKGFGGQAAAMRGEPNTIGVPTKWRPDRTPRAYFSDDDWEDGNVRRAILGAFGLMAAAIDDGRNVVIPADGLGTGLAELPQRAPRIHAFILRAIEALARMNPPDKGSGGPHSAPASATGVNQ